MSTAMRDSLAGFLNNHHIPGWDGNRAEPLDRCVHEAGMKLVNALPAGNFILGKRGTDKSSLVYAEIHHAAHEETPVFRFYVDKDMFGPSYFAITVRRDGKYAFELEASELWVHGVTNSAEWMAKDLMDWLSDLGDLTIE